MMRVVLVEPEYEGNLGLVARVCKNFGIKELVLVNPKADPLGKEALIRAVHAKELLENAVVVESLEEAVKGTSYVVGTTAKTACEYNVNRSHVMPWELKRVKGMALVLGRESSGLTNKELASCDVLVHIPTSPKYKTMNISHALAVLLYELSRKEERRGAGRELLAQLGRFWSAILDELGYTEKKEVQVRIFRRVLGKASPTPREAHGMAGVLHRVLKRIKNLKRDG